MEISQIQRLSVHSTQIPVDLATRQSEKTVSGGQGESDDHDILILQGYADASDAAPGIALLLTMIRGAAASEEPEYMLLFRTVSVDDPQQLGVGKIFCGDGAIIAESSPEERMVLRWEGPKTTWKVYYSYL